MSAPSTEDLVQWEIFRNSMRKRREKLGLTQIQLSEKMGRSQDYISYLENNTRQSIPNMATVMLWTSALGGTLGVDWDD